MLRKIFNNFNRKVLTQSNQKNGQMIYFFPYEILSNDDNIKNKKRLLLKHFNRNCNFYQLFKSYQSDNDTNQDNNQTKYILVTKHSKFDIDYYLKNIDVKIIQKIKLDNINIYILNFMGDEYCQMINIRKIENCECFVKLEKIKLN